MAKAGRWEDGKAGVRMAAGWIEMMELAGQSEFEGTWGNVGQIFCQYKCHRCAGFGRSVPIYSSRKVSHAF